MSACSQWDQSYVDGATKAVYGGTSTHVIAQQKIAQSKLFKILKRNWNIARIEVDNVQNAMVENNLKIYSHQLYLGSVVSGDRLE